MYKACMFISYSLAPTALFYCCSPDLRSDIILDLQDDVSTMKEEDLLAAIRRLAVKDENALVHRIRLSKMTQRALGNNDEILCSFPDKTLFGSVRFSINLTKGTNLTSENVPFHDCNPRFDQNDVVRNTYTRHDRSWSGTKERDGGFPFSKDAD
ncbi:hypothetical protein RRG08_027706 [Elysia crispata]|uniref:Galectin n=1 Tax=Elysia crispata TaxID=231223 RepID=A0AAE0XNA6_9GAST|nr:hypothetical protein RRG08_027706 [Elysia crispata]